MTVTFNEEGGRKGNHIQCLYKDMGIQVLGLQCRGSACLKAMFSCSSLTVSSVSAECEHSNGCLVEVVRSIDRVWFLEQTVAGLS